jgi:hypothetical protein
MDRPYELKKKLKGYYEEIKSHEVTGEGGAKVPANVKQKVGKVFDDARQRADPIIAQELLKIGLDVGGVPNAYALSLLAKQIIESGDITDTKQIARGVDSSTETLAAQLVTGLITNEKVTKPSEAELITKLFKNMQNSQ